jgi:hypothetical protein
MTPVSMPRGPRTVELDQDEMASARVRNFENENSTPQRATLDVIQRALEAAGVEFTNGEQPGVRVTKAAASRSAELDSALNPRIAAKAARRKTVKATEKKR